MFKALIKTMRPRQWIKNGFIFFGLIFDKQLFMPEQFLKTAAGFFLFCLISSSVYLFNDVADVEADRNHPEKKFRPIASGQLPVGMALTTALLLTVIALPLAYLLAPAFALILGVYLINNVLYSRWLKHVPVLDVLILSSGFVLRVAAGVILISPVERFSPWLYMITVLFSLYIVLGKRRAELHLLAQGASAHRKVFNGYTLPLLDQYITIVSGMTIVAYSSTFSAPNLPKRSYDDAHDPIRCLWHLSLPAIDPDRSCRRFSCGSCAQRSPIADHRVVVGAGGDCRFLPLLRGNYD
jgi:4-hydroxybenzoate polyprenyltransferase